MLIENWDPWHLFTNFHSLTTQNRQHKIKSPLAINSFSLQKLRANNHQLTFKRQNSSACFNHPRPKNKTQNLYLNNAKPHVFHNIQTRKFSFDEEADEESDISEWAELEQTIKKSGRTAGKSKAVRDEEREMAIYEQFMKYQNHLLANKPENILVSGPLRDRMWQLHISDPKVYTVFRLASQFRLEPNRVMAILYFRQKEKETELLSGKNASTLLEQEYAKRFPTTHDPNQPDQYTRTHLIPGLHWQALEDEVDEALHTAKVWGYNDRLPMWLRKKEFDPKVPPVEFAGPPKIIKGPTRGEAEIKRDMERKRIPKGGGKVVVIDTSKFTRDPKDLSLPQYFYFFYQIYS